MLNRWKSKIESMQESIKQIASNTVKSAGATDAVKALKKQKETFEKIITVLVKVISFLLIPIYMAFILVVLVITGISRAVYKGIYYGIKGLKAVLLKTGVNVRIFAFRALKLLPKDFKFLNSFFKILGKGILILLVPPIFILLLIIILISKLFPFLYKWIAYGVTAIKVIFAFVGETRSANENNLDEVIEFTGFAYDPEKDIFYSTMNPWQRKFGYCRLYDEAAALWGMIVDCEPVYFDYDGKKWLLEFWKGQYDLTTGCEIGIYTTEGPSLDIPGVFNGTFYNSGSNEDRLKMSYTLKKKDKALFSMEAEHWWLTGFKLGEFSNPKELSMNITLNFKDQIMCKKFVNGLKKAGYSDNEINKTQTKVSFYYDKPKTPQPFTRMKLTDWIIQRKNKRMCKKFQKLVGSSKDMETKLLLIEQKAPKLYAKILNLGKSQKLYSKCRIINNYLK